jgi:hypothetical protein
MAKKSDIKGQHRLSDLGENRHFLFYCRSLCLTIDDLLLNKKDYPYLVSLELILKPFAKGVLRDNHEQQWLNIFHRNIAVYAEEDRLTS